MDAVDVGDPGICLLLLGMGSKVMKRPIDLCMETAEVLGQVNAFVVSWHLLISHSCEEPWVELAALPMIRMLGTTTWIRFTYIFAHCLLTQQEQIQASSRYLLTHSPGLFGSTPSSMGTASPELRVHKTVWKVGRWMMPFAQNASHADFDLSQTAMY